MATKKHSPLPGRCPPHPGTSVRDDVLPVLGLNITAAAKQLRVTRPTLSRVLNGQAAVSPRMALRLEVWLGADCRSADALVAQQAAFDLWQARQEKLPQVARARWPDRRP